MKMPPARMRPSALKVSLVALAAALAPAARALDVFGYALAPTTYERFNSGLPTGTAGTAVSTNSSFFLNSFNLSGIGWSSGNFGITMISPQHFVTAAHVAPANGSTVTFVSSDGFLRTYTVDSTFVIEHSAGVSTDLVVGRLTAPISGADNVTYYPTLLLNNASLYNGLSVAALGNGQRAGTNTIEQVALVDMLPFGSPNGTNDNIVLYTDFDSVNGQSQGQGGDSGSPTFLNFNGTLTIVGTHSAIDTVTSPNRTFDVFLPSYYTEINNRLALDGYTFSAIPEPGAWSMLAGAGAMAGAVTWRRRRSRGAELESRR